MIGVWMSMRRPDPLADGPKGVYQLSQRTRLANGVRTFVHTTRSDADRSIGCAELIESTCALAAHSEATCRWPLIRTSPAAHRVAGAMWLPRPLAAAV